MLQSDGRWGKGLCASNKATEAPHQGCFTEKHFIVKHSSVILLERAFSFTPNHLIWSNAWEKLKLLIHVSFAFSGTVELQETQGLQTVPGLCAVTERLRPHCHGHLWVFHYRTAGTKVYNAQRSRGFRINNNLIITEKQGSKSSFYGLLQTKYIWKPFLWVEHI